MVLKMNMDKPTFYVFGVPDGFNLYQGDANATNYFQSFYDGSKENAKLTIHRRANGQVSYSYLRYKLFSAEGRPGAFFGMSLVFDGKFCYDIAKLYRLFDSVFCEIILKNKILIEEVNGNPNIQAKYLVRTFKDKETEIQNIESIIIKNIENKFTKDIHTINSSFKQGKPNLIRKINIKRDNDVINKALQNYSWVSISLEYKDDEINLSQDAIANLDKKIEDVLKNFVGISVKLVQGIDVKSDIENSYQLIRDGKKTLHPYLKTQSELKERNEKFDNILKQLDELNKALSSKFENTRDSFTEIKQIKDNSNNENEKKKGEKENDQNLSPIIKIVHKKHRHKTFTLVGLVLVSLVVAFLILKLLPSHSTSSSIDCPECAEYLNNGDSFLQNNNFNDAIKEYKRVNAKGIDVSYKIDEANSKAVDFYEAKAKEEFNDVSGRRKIENYSAAIVELKKVKQYDANYDVDWIKDKYKNKTIDYYLEVIDTTQNIENKKMYLGFILDLDSVNADAKKISESLEEKAKPKSNAVINKCIKNYAISRDTKAKDYSPEELYRELKKFPETSYQIIIDGCIQIETSCGSKEMKNDAKKWREEAVKKKKNAQSAI